MFTLSSTPGARLRATGITCPATSAAVAQCRCAAGSRMSSENAAARTPETTAVIAAPTVPECSTTRPVFGPRLMPDSSSRGTGPNAPRTAVNAMNPGAACTA